MHYNTKVYYLNEKYIPNPEIHIRTCNINAFQILYSEKYLF